MKFLSKQYVMENGGYVGVEFTLGDGRKLTFMNGDYDEALVERAMCHCTMQKIGDAASGFSKASDFHGAFLAMEAVADGLENGLWARRASTGTADIVAALANLTSKSMSEAQEVVDKLDEDTLKKLKADPNMKAEIARLKAERAAAQVSGSFDPSSLFD